MATHPGSIGFGISLMALLVAVHALLLGIVVWRWNAKPLLTLLLFTTALAAHYMDSYNVYLDADMLRNVLHTDHKESRELLTPGLIPAAAVLLPDPERAAMAHASARAQRGQGVPSAGRFSAGRGAGRCCGHHAVIAGYFRIDAQPSRSALPGHADQLHRGTAAESQIRFADEARAQAADRTRRHGHSACAGQPPASVAGGAG
ncbi:DUF1705 domain-containing protein [Xanthomonas oryzae pv. oryzae]|nr:DUF1705 domain-containing protein [Xanthomonas oryzae pv. oryzae]